MPFFYDGLMRHGLRYGSQCQLENDMHEWIIAPLLEPDPTGMVAHRATGPEEDKAAREEAAAERRHGDRRDKHDDEADPDFARGEDRRDDAPAVLR
jgi:hypothetical protein